MKHSFAPILITFFVTGNCFAQTQAEMNKVAAEAYKKADSELNTIYQQVLMEYSDDTTFLEALNTSQRNWIIFRNSEFKMKYPDREPGWYGSIQPMCVSYYMAELTNERSAKLKLWLTEIDEGDACAGTVRQKR